VIRVRVEFVPSRNADKAKQIAELEIYNTGQDGPFSDYVVRGMVVDRHGNTKLFNRALNDFHRLRWNVLGLLLAALQVIGPDPMKDEGMALDGD
jgi:hypothetical protein